MCESSSSVLPRQARSVATSYRRSPASRTVGRSTGPRARERSQARGQLVERERLGQVVVGAAIEAADPVLDRGARGEHQHRRPDPLGAHLLARREAVHAGQHHVQHRDVHILHAQNCERVIAAVHGRDTHPRLRQASLQQPRELAVVFNDQYAHGSCKGGDPA